MATAIFPNAIESWKTLRQQMIKGNLVFKEVMEHFENMERRQLRHDMDILLKELSPKRHF